MLPLTRNRKKNVSKSPTFDLPRTFARALRVRAGHLGSKSSGGFSLHQGTVEGACIVIARAIENLLPLSSTSYSLGYVSCFHTA